MSDLFEKKLHDLSQQTFDSQLNTINDSVKQRLRQSRQQAIAAIPQYSKANAIVINFPAWLSTVSTATAFASIAIVASLLWLQPEFNNESNMSPLDDISILTSNDEFEMYENLDFYLWLENEDSAG